MRRIFRLLRRIAVPLLRRWRPQDQPERQLILSSGLFDPEWYCQTYPDVRPTGIDPVTHYLRHGAAKGYDPNPLFDSDWYLRHYADVAKAQVNPLVHYVCHGAAEARAPGPSFDTAWYLDRYPDIGALGINPLAHYLQHGAAEGREKRPMCSPNAAVYRRWIKAYDSLGAADIDSMRRAAEHFALQPLISVVMPTYNCDPIVLQRAIDSILGQIYTNWELCISDDASTQPHVRPELERYARQDARIRVTFRETNGDVAANSNTALSLATGDFVALLDADDELSPDALFWVANEIACHPDVDLIYSDEDKLDEYGDRFDPHFKTDWNPSLMLSQNMFSHLGVFRRSLVTRAGGFRIGFEGSQDHDLVLRCSELTEAKRIRHIPRVLYHWRATADSTASAQALQAKPYAWQAGARAISEHLERSGTPATIKRVLDQFYQVEYSASAQPPKVSVVIPSAFTGNMAYECISRLLSRTTYPDFEILLAVSRSTLIESKKYLDTLTRDPRVRVLAYEHEPFNYSKVNNWAIRQSDAPVICLLNDDVDVITPEWLDQLVARVQLPGVGAAAPMLYYPDDTIQHAGVILGLGGVAGHAHLHLPKGTRGYFGRAALEQDLSCVTAACMVMRREAFDSAGGFNEGLAVAFNDVDLCIKMRNAGWRIIWTSAAELYHRESASFGRHNSPKRAAMFEREVKFMRETWCDILDNDRFYNPNLSLMSHTFELAFPPRIARTPHGAKTSPEIASSAPGVPLSPALSNDRKPSGGDPGTPTPNASDPLGPRPVLSAPLSVPATQQNFDERGYLAANPDVAEAVRSGRQASARAHFDKFGVNEGRLQHVPNAIAELQKEKLARIAPLLKLDMPHTRRGVKYDFLTEELRLATGIVDTSAISENGYDRFAKALIEEFADGIVLDCGAGRRSTYFTNVVNYEIVDYESTDVIGVGECLPFKDDFVRRCFIACGA